MKQIPHSKPYVGQEELNLLKRVIYSGRLSQGPQVAALECELSDYVGHRYGVAVSSGTSALYLALKALDIKKMDTVIIPSYVCTALLNSVNLTGATPILSDVDPLSGNMRVEDVTKVLRKNTKAVIVPHLFGNPAPAREIESLGVPVIEDCAQCVGATNNNLRTGGLTKVSIFSFYSTKVLAAGEGGMVATSDPDIAKRVRNIRDYDECEKYEVRFNFKLSDIHAACARVQLKKLSRMIRVRRKIAQQYSDILNSVNSEIKVVKKNSQSNPMFFRYVIRKKSGAKKFILEMKNRGIICAQPVFKPLHKYLNRKNFPGSDFIFKTAISIPIYPAMKSSEVEKVCSVLEKVL